MTTLDFFPEGSVFQPEDSFTLRDFAVVIEETEGGFDVGFWSLQTHEGHYVRSSFDKETALNIAKVLHSALWWAD